MATVAEQMKKMSQTVFGASGSTGMAAMPSLPKPAAPALPAAPAAAPAVPQYDDSAASNLAKITTSDSPLMKQAAATGLATANRRGLLNSSIAVGASQGEVLRAATPIAQADAAAGLQKNLQNSQAASAIDQIREQGKVTGGLQQQQQQATAALSAQEAKQLSDLEKQRAAATTDQQRADIQAQMDRLLQSQKGASSLSAQEASQLADLERQRAAATTDQQRADIQAQMDRLLQSQKGTSALSSQEATQLAELERQRASATTDQQIRDIDAQMARLRESGSQELTRLGAASQFEQQRLILAGQIDAAAAGTAAENQRALAVLQGSIQSALQSQTDASTMQRLSAQYAQELTVQDRAIKGDLQKIAASGNEDVRRALVAAETARDQLAMQLAANDRTNAANTAVQIFQAEATIRSNLLGNSSMPAAERSAYEAAISSLGNPVRNFVNSLYGKPAAAGTTTAPTSSGLVQPTAPAAAPNYGYAGYGGSGGLMQRMAIQ